MTSHETLKLPTASSAARTRMSVPSGLCRGFVKQVLSGDAVVVRGVPKGGPPPERTICLSNVTAPRIARRANPNVEGALETKDEPCAWEAREFLRKKLVGKEVVFTVEYKAGAANREYGCIWLGKDQNGENITELMVAEGLVEVKRGGLFQNNESQQKLAQLEDAAKASGKGKWSPDAENNVRSITWTIENPRHFVDSQHGKKIPAVIEHVRDGCTVRAFLLPSMNYVTVMLSGIKCPMFKLDGDKQVAEEFAEEAKYFTEVRLLQRDVHIILEGVSNQNLLGTVIHPNGNIAELLLKEGFARCVDWSMGVVTQGAEKLRQAEKIAKEKKVRLWKDYTASTVKLDIKDRCYTGKVVEVVNGDGLVVKTQDGEYRKIFLASIRPPRMPVSDTDDDKEEKKSKPTQRSRPLYDIPYMFEAREFMRKKLIGKKVNVEVDYIQPASGGFPEKTCCTVTFSNINIAEALVSKGFATVVRYRQDNDQRSSHYDELLSAEARATKKGAGLHSKKDNPVHRVADVSGDVTKAKQFLPFLQRAGRMEAVVEFVASGSRLRLYIPRETCLITFLLSGISCPRAARPGPGGAEIPGEPFGQEALVHTKELCLQREVEVEVETMDKGGNFIGYMYVEGTNVSVALVDQGLAKVHFTAERSNHYKALSAAEERAKEKKTQVWSLEEEEEQKEVKVENEPLERKINHKTVLVTEICNNCNFYAQNVESGPHLEKLMEQMRTELAASPPLAGSYTPKKGDICLAKFTDDEWYRAKITKVFSGKADVLYIDYGNSCLVAHNRLASMPAVYNTLSPQATEYSLACIQIPTDEEARLDAVDALCNDVLNQQVLLNVEYRNAGIECVTLQYTDSKDDAIEAIVSAGLLLVENRKEKRLSKLVQTYQKAQSKAKASRLNLWRYGDFTDDDAKEFGYQP